MAPTRPRTPTLDTFYTTNYGAQNPPHEDTANGPVDHALEAFQTDKTYEAAKAAVNPDEVTAASQYLDDAEAWIKLHGGFWLANDPAYHTDVSELQAENSAHEAAAASSSSSAPASIDPNDKPAETGVATDRENTRELEVGDHVSVVGPDGSTVHGVVVPHGPLAELTKLVGEIRQYVGAGAHHLVADAEKFAAELRAHL